ncbi:MAG: tetratricopeptide repeat protein [Lachnospiraceae bacterium]|nr:tetratricopeptide repeat protein [Lachnospiraceae bacterium]
MKSIIKKTILAAGLGVFILTAAGCGKTTEKIDRGMELISSLNYSEALELFEEALLEGEEKTLAYRGEGIAYMGLTRYDEAVTAFENALHENTGSVRDVDFDTNYYLAAAFVKLGKYEEAKSVYDAILAIRPKEENALLLRGINSLELSDIAGAKADFDEVMAMDPENYNMVVDVFNSLKTHGYETEGKEYVLYAITNHKETMGDFNLGRFYYLLEDYENAAMCLEQTRNANLWEGYLYLGKSYEATGDLNYAASVYNSYLAKDSSNAVIYNQLGLCEMKRENYEAALTAFEKGKNLEASDVTQELAFNTIVAYEYLGEYKKASVLLDTYLKTYPDDVKAIREQKFLNTR